MSEQNLPANSEHLSPGSLQAGSANPANDAVLAENSTTFDSTPAKSGWLEKQQRQFRLSLTLKVSLWFGIPLVVGFIGLFKLVFDSQQQFQSRQMDGFAQVISDQLAASAAEPLFADAYMELGVLLQRIPLTDTLIGIAIYDHQNKSVAQIGTVPRNHASFDPQQSKTSLSASQLYNETVVLAGRNTNENQSSSITQVLLYSTPITFRDVVGGRAVVVFDKSSMDYRVRQTHYALLSIALFLVGFLAAVVFYFSHRITAPIRQIVDAANRIDSGDISPILERRNDELGQLINAINNMTKGLAEKSQIKEVLDRFVDRDVSNKILSQLDSVNFKGENVNATVLFADIVGFTSMSEKLPPDRVSELLNEYFGYYSACAKMHFGTVDKFLGDCIMIVFGASREDSQHQYHAACCALLMQELTARINELRRAQGLDTITIRIGINSGKMLAGLLGSRDRLEYTVVGDSVNLASRLCNEATSGQIIVQESLCQQLEIGHQLQLGIARTIKVRGKAEPIAIYDLRGIARPRSTGDRAMINDLLEKARLSLTPI